MDYKDLNGIQITDKIKIYNCDNMELLKQTPDNYYELSIVDPPYGYGKKETQILNFRQKEQHRDWNIAPDQKYWDELFRVSKNQIVWGGNYFPYIWGFGGRCFIYWHKGNPVDNFADGELAWTSFDKNAKQFDFRYYGNLEGNSSTSEKFHITQKPRQLYNWLLDNYAKEGDKILDTHLGSGSIALACHDRGFELTACELDKEYYEAAIKRIQNYTAQQTIFDQGA
jgi:site-specific DNA-methyltransferase (adenine-specific)